MGNNETGAVIDRGAQNWQIFQQGPDGTADIAVAGHWLTNKPFTKAVVIVRLVMEESGDAVTCGLDWQVATAAADGTWSIVLKSVPRGGLYRLETGLRLDDCAFAWASRGDLRHHLGVGDLWVIAGQSNAVGYGKMPVQDPPELGLHLFRASGEWALATHPLADSTRTRYPVCREEANASHSPFLAFARTLKRRLGYPIGIVPTALGGSPISQWVKSLDGRLFDNMFDFIRDAGGRIRGLCWYQGCTDTLTPERDRYLAYFAEFVADLRRELGDPDLPILTAQINRVVNHQPGAPTNAAWDLIREAQRQAARTIPGVGIVATLDCGLADCIHNHAAANLVIGERLAALALGQVYGRKVQCLHPDLDRARLVAPRTVELTFANVNQTLIFEVADPAQWPFAVNDRAGLVPLAGLKMAGPASIHLELARNLDGPATVTGAPGTNPPAIVPFDTAGLRPILAFTALVTQS